MTSPASLLAQSLKWTVLSPAPLGTNPLSSNQFHNPCSEIPLSSTPFGDGSTVPDQCYRLRDLFALKQLDVKYSVPTQELVNESIFTTFEPITMTEGAPPWAKFFFRYRREEAVLVPKTILTTWMEGRWTARVNTATYPVTISAWFECEEDVVLLKLAGLPLSEKFVVLSGKS